MDEEAAWLRIGDCGSPLSMGRCERHPSAKSRGEAASA